VASLVFVAAAGAQSAPAAPPAPNASKLQVITPLTLTNSDIRIENSNDGGYILYVRAKPEIKSILITESTEPGDHKTATYAMRSASPHPFNNDQKRLLDGKVVNQPNLYYLVTSTSLADPQFGQAYRLFLPYVIEFGYPEGRNGRIQLMDQAFLSIRSFAKPWADYSGAYLDNPYKLVLTQLPPVVESGSYNQEAFRVFESIAMESKSRLRQARDRQDLGTAIAAILDEQTGPDLDLVLCIDCTGSMTPYQQFVKTELIPILRGYLEGHPQARFGFVEYRDYFEEFIYRATQFTTDFGMLQRSLDRYRPTAGGDIPEAVDEALYGTMSDLKWQASKRLIILVGDAPPHPIPRGKITRQMVEDKAQAMHVQIVPIILPSDGKSALPAATKDKTVSPATP
jgi:hypothetical protein